MNSCTFLVSLNSQSQPGPARTKELILQVGRVLEFVTLGYCAEDADYDGANDDCCDDGLQEDSVLDLSESWLLNPHLTIEHLPDDIALVVLDNPWFVFVAVVGAEAVK
jgi:hypothetical protein